MSKTVPVLKSGKRTAFPQNIMPMLCTLVQEPFTKEGWVYEVKWDGYRIIAYKNKKEVILRSRAGLNYSDRYVVVVEAIKKIKGDFVIDGEVVAFDEKGKIDFDAVQSANPQVPLAYYVFDILWKDGTELIKLPLKERKQLLEKFLPENDVVKYSSNFPDGLALFQQAQKLDFEGIVAKKEDSIYQPGKRGRDWLKIPTAKRQEFVIGGWTESDSGRPFRSILFGAYENGRFNWIGHSGSGFKESLMKEIIQKLKPLEIKKNPFVNKVEYETTPHWVKPQLVANFKFSTWTASGKIRKPAIFLGFRYDKKPKDVVREIPSTNPQDEQVTEEAKTIYPKKNGNRRSAKYTKPIAGSNWPELEKLEITTSDKIQVNGCTVELTNVEHLLWEGITKAGLIGYYNNVANYILPHLKNRPLSLHVKPYSPTAPGLYIKDMEGRQPECADIFSTVRKHPKPGKRNIIDYLVCNNKATLLYLINLGCIDVNPWTSTIDDYLHPNFIIIDLDPSDEDFKKAIITAQAAKQFFDDNKLKSFVKTSGKTGIHLFIPCVGFTFPEARRIAVNICSQVHDLVPAITTTTVSVNQRGNKLYIDPNQNDEADTVACAYSCRPYKNPTVSTPLEWKEIQESLKPENFTIKTILKRLEKKGDLFKGVNDLKVKKA